MYCYNSSDVPIPIVDGISSLVKVCSYHGFDVDIKIKKREKEEKKDVDKRIDNFIDSWTNSGSSNVFLRDALRDFICCEIKERQ